MDGKILFLTRAGRMFAYGFLAVVLVLYLAAVGLSDGQIGLLLTLTLAGDTVMSLVMTTTADRIGRRTMLAAGAGLMAGAGVVFAFTEQWWLLLAAATVGVISPSGYEVGPFLSIEQAALAQVVDPRRRTRTFAWYNLTGSLATATGALCGGWLAGGLQGAGWSAVSSFRVLLVGYAVVGAGLLGMFCFLTAAVEVNTAPLRSRLVETENQASKATQAWRCLGLFKASKGGGPRTWLGLGESRKVVFKLSGLFALDAFGGGFVLQSILAYWFVRRFGANEQMLGSIFFGANLLAAISSLSAAWLAERIGLIRTMVFTHIPSNVLLMLVPLMPNVEWAIAVLMLRFSISQMDVPTRQSYTMAVVRPEERSAAAGVTGVARTTGASVAPLFTGLLLGNAALMNVPFFVAGGLKIVYDVLLYRSFVKVRLEEERGRSQELGVRN
ncbi:MAG: MFS transporter [Phycisphaeraceae bacterium]|nr:MFS transporter [Phycisphaeraceae bacterium]